MWREILKGIAYAVLAVGAAFAIMIILVAYAQIKGYYERETINIVYNCTSATWDYGQYMMNFTGG